MVQLCCKSDLRKHKWGENENGSRQIKTENDIELKDGLVLHRKFLEAIDYLTKISKKIFPLNCSLETEQFKKVLQSENREAKEQGDLEDNESGAVSFELFWFMCRSAL